MNKIIVDTVKRALQEDIGSKDVSADLIDNDKIMTAELICRDKAVICAKDYFNETFSQIDKNITINWLVKEGDYIKKNTIICAITGNSKTILSGERTAINFLQTLCSSATATYKLNEKITTNTKILDTRKTIPNLRYAQKQAVLAGGGHNHRMGLYDAIMIKENHIIALGSITNAVKKAKEKYPKLDLIVEIETIKQLKEALLLPIDRILCDNFSVKKLKKTVKINNSKIPLEISGNINKKNIKKYVQTGVDFISIGSITKNIKSIDFSLRFKI